MRPMYVGDIYPLEAGDGMSWARYFTVHPNEVEHEAQNYACQLYIWLWYSPIGGNA